MKDPVIEYWLDALKFDQMADEAKDERFKAAYSNQAAQCRELAIKRAQRLGLPPPSHLPPPFHQN